MPEALTEHFPITDLLRRSASGNELPLVVGRSRVFESVFQGATGGYKIFKVN
jgi:hypothetical protein